MTARHTFYAFALCALACAEFAMPVARAQSVAYHVALDTSGLEPSFRGPFALDFQFDDGGTPDNNTVTLTNFAFGGGSAANAPSELNGGASGSANSTIALADTDFLNELVQDFTPGQSLTFDIALTTNPDTAPGGSPDEFSFSLFDGNGNNIITTAPNSAFVTIDIDSSDPTVTVAGTLGGAGLFIAPPSVTRISVTPVPEAGGAFIALVGMAGVSLAVGSRCFRSRRRC